MQTQAVVLEKPNCLSLKGVDLVPVGAGDIVVDVLWSGISTGTEKLLWDGSMPPFPGLGYPLVPGYEAVGRIIAADGDTDHAVGDLVFVPGARCYENAHALFGASAAKLVVKADRTIQVPDYLGQDAVLLALAATAHKALTSTGAPLPGLIVGHGVLGRLLARLTIALDGEAPVVWERNSTRARGGEGYDVIPAEDDDRRDYGAVIDASGDPAIVDAVMPHLTPRGEITLAGFYSQPVAFAFPPAFMREARIKISAEFSPADTAAVLSLIAREKLSLDGLITHHAPASDAPRAYETAFGDADCLKFILDWRTLQ